MQPSVPVRIDGREVYAVVSEARGGALMLRLDLDEWDGLGLPKGRRIRLLCGHNDRWYTIVAVMRPPDAPPTAWVSLSPAEPPEKPTRRGPAHGVPIKNYRVGA